MIDFELTHLALWATDLDASVAFYREFASMSVAAERREPSGTRVAWIADEHQRVILALLSPRRLPWRKRLGISFARRFGPPSHIGVECASRDRIVDLCDRARARGILRKAPSDRGGEAGFVGIIADPDGNDLELSFGQNTRSVLSE